ncbi:MAG TPA: SDR family oxidoreductase [Xanthobacteraceae bacterium]|jgi:3-oxoacyl-[acyl-carrier protein] reductase|nr:SDR family oxidoreductase [Xanthobacteraceae bacterium]
MDLQLRGRSALVTGASMGIGRAIAAALAAEGAKIAVVARRGELLEKLAEEIVAAGGTRPAIIVADMMAPESPLRIRDEALSALGAVEILVNCAGASRPLPVDADDEKWDEAMTLNFTRVRQLTHALLPQMQARGFGRIINITGKSEPDRLNAAFAAKAGIHAWSKGLSREIGKQGITVNCVAPGRIMSEQIRRLYPESERKALSDTEIAVGRYGEPEDVALVVTMLASPRAAYFTGIVVPVDGGLRRYQF